jgi:hypothetical protein
MTRPSSRLACARAVPLFPIFVKSLKAFCAMRRSEERMDSMQLAVRALAGAGRKRRAATEARSLPPPSVASVCVPDIARSIARRTCSHNAEL